MRAAVFYGAGRPLAIDTIDDPRPTPADVIIKVHRCGICGTDLHMTSGSNWDFKAGTIPGHEYAGEIVEIGSQVNGFRTGDLITALPSQGCRRCEACTRGHFTLCHNAGGLMGGFGEFLRIPAYVAVRLPRTFSLADGALVEPFAVALYGARMAAIRPGDRVLVLGGGSVGLTTIFWAKRLGAGRIVAASRSARRADLVLTMGADAFVQTGENDKQEIAAALGGAPDVVFECAGVPGLLSRAIQHAGLYGHVVSMGFCTSPDTLIPAIAAYKGVRLSFAVGYTLRDFEHAANVMLAGTPDPKVLITSVVSLDELPATFEALREPNAHTKVQVAL